ncbi:hypothetical protein [Paraglaciecola hydrolytica]|uniref:PEP-CTERM protein-sorting domain-containing protein n=1 Tax=Paraglaciecola hydrolytica TaxID=1799789 RepID=A0A135ZZS0_9ALTE|nr:hypothetical protein [Paraglaciecola hydrolytica]KXI28464.1 hypothetical protein AX660_15325 [Paraglaciecola hydrolytica]
MKYKYLKVACLGLGLTISGMSNAAFINFTGGTATFNAGGTGVTDNSTSFQDVANYIESGFMFEFFFSGPPSPFASTIGDYYGTGNDVAHWHWDNGPYGEVIEVRVSKVDNSMFDLGGFRVSTNTSVGGGSSTGTEKVSINTSKATGIFNVASDSWGLGNGPDPLITISSTNTLFDDITWFSFTNDVGSDAVGMGLDNFFFDEIGDANGNDPTGNPVPGPSTLTIFILGFVGLVLSRFKKLS